MLAPSVRPHLQTPVTPRKERGTLFGCGMGTIPLGDGVVGVQAIVEALLEIGFDGPTTLEVAGTENVKISVERLTQWSKA